MKSIFPVGASESLRFCGTARSSSDTWLIWPRLWWCFIKLKGHSFTEKFYSLTYNILVVHRRAFSHAQVNWFPVSNSRNLTSSRTISSRNLKFKWLTLYWSILLLNFCLLTSLSLMSTTSSCPSSKSSMISGDSAWSTMISSSTVLEDT